MVTGAFILALFHFNNARPPAVPTIAIYREKGPAAALYSSTMKSKLACTLTTYSSFPRENALLFTL